MIKIKCPRLVPERRTCRRPEMTGEQRLGGFDGFALSNLVASTDCCILRVKEVRRVLKL
jgi:hypothetical protein